MTRNFVVTVKERQVNQPCFLVFEPHEEINLDENQSIVFDMPDGTNISDARKIAKMLNGLDVKLKIFDF